MESLFTQKITMTLSSKIINGVKSVAQYSIYSASICADYNMAQTLMAVLFHSLAQGDIDSSTALLALGDQVPQFRSSFVKKWLRDDFHFPQSLVMGGLDTLARMVVYRETSLTSPLVSAMVGLEKKYHVESFFTRSTILWSGKIKNAAKRVDTLRNAVVRNDSAAIFAQVKEGADLAVSSGCSEASGADSNGVRSSEELTPISINNVPSIFNQKSRAGGSPLHEAASRGIVETIEALVRLGAEVDSRDSQGQTPLHLAANSDVVRFLVSKGADVDRRSPTGDSPLHLAAARGSGDVVRALLAAKATVDVRNNNEATPLLVAAQAGRTEVVRLLLTSGADPHLKDSSENTCLQLAAGEGHLGCAQLLMDAGLDVNTRDFGGRTPLHDSASNGHLAVVQALLMKGAEVDPLDCEGFTALHLAAWTGSSQIVKALIDAGSDISKRDGFYNRTPLEWASIYKHTSTIKLLKSRGAV